MKKITSRTNQEIKKISALHDAKHRKKSGLFIAEGLRVIETLIHTGMEPIDVYVSQTCAFPFDYPYTEVSEPVMQKISSAKNPSGIVAIFKIPIPTKAPTAPGLVLTQISDPGNMGTLIRSAAAFGITQVVIIDGCDPWSPKVIQASAGTIGMVAIHQLSWAELQKQNLTLCALVVQDGESPDQLDLKNSMIVVGSEAHGIPDEWLANCKKKLTVPMPGKTESLNAAVAGSIALYLATKNLT